LLKSNIGFTCRSAQHSGGCALNERKACSKCPCSVLYVIVIYTFPEFSSKTLSGKYVVYEEIYYVKEVTDEKTNKTSSTLHLIAEHKDLTDTKQTLSVKPDTPKTGDTFPVIPIVIGFIFSILGIGAIVFMKKRSSRAAK